MSEVVQESLEENRDYESMLGSWDETHGVHIHEQFQRTFWSNNNPLELPGNLRSDTSEYRYDKLAYIASTHSNAIVRTKACIILSRSSSGLNSDFDIEWDINELRQLIKLRWGEISDGITPRWCVSILNCFAENGDQCEMTVGNSVNIFYNLLVYGPDTDFVYTVDDMFITLMLRVNLSLTPEVRTVLLTLLHLLGTAQPAGTSENTPQIRSVAIVWKLAIHLSLTTTQQVCSAIKRFYPRIHESLWSQYN